MDNTLAPLTVQVDEDRASGQILTSAAQVAGIFAVASAALTAALAYAIAVDG